MESRSSPPGDRSRHLAWKPIMNPYQPPKVSATLPDRSTRGTCPACEAPINQWSIVNAAWSYRCTGCNKKLKVVPPLWAIVFMFTWAGLPLLYLAFAGYRSANAFLTITIMNILLVPISIWLRYRFGAIKTSSKL